LSGKTVQTEIVKKGRNQFNTAALPKGVYVLKAGENTVKIVK
jgi:hypothetical protein